MLITFEGPDGSGKTTQVELLRRWLADRDPLVLREPGGTEVGERIRELLLHSQMAPETELYLFLAARAQLAAELVRPALAGGRIVILDRYHDSTLAYQGGARGLQVGDWPLAFPKPGLTFLLALPAAAGLERRHAAGGGNRMEAEALPFHDAVAAAYDRMAKAEPRRWVRLDATQAPEELHRQVRERVAALLEVSKSS